MAEEDTVLWGLSGPFKMSPDVQDKHFHVGTERGTENQKKSVSKMENIAGSAKNRKTLRAFARNCRKVRGWA